MFENRKSVITSLKKCSLFSKAGDELLQWLVGEPGCAVKFYHKDAIIAFRGDKYERLLLVLKGSMAAELQDFRGKVLKVESLREGESAATAILFASENVLPVTLTAECDTYLFVIPKRTVLQAMQRSSDLLENIITDMGNRVAVLADKIFSLQFSTIKQKISAYLLDLSNKQGTDSPELKVTKEILAEIFGVTRPALSRCFSSMVRDGYFVQEGRIIHLTDKSELEAALEDE